MGMIGTFDAFTTARLGIYAAQHGLRVTGNNISNINTAGYTRQRIDQVSLKTGASDMYRSTYDNHVGNGALVTGINQIRDPYLDIRYRNTSSDVGFYDTMLGGLQQIASILDEVGKGENGGDGLLYAELMKLSTALRQLESNPNKDNDNLTRASAEALASLFRTYADKLDTLKKNTLEGFEKDISSVNEILTNIRNLNESIRDNELQGDNALELRDERNRQIDALSEYMHIRVEYSMEDAGAGKQVEKLTIRLGNSNPDPTVTTDSSVLIDGLFGTQVSVKMVPKANPDYDANDPNSFQYLKPDNTGTNDPDEAEQVYDENYILQLGKLVDRRGKEWEGRTSAYKELTQAELLKPPYNMVLGEKAAFSYKFTPAAGAQWADGETFEIGGKIFTIGKDIPLTDANDPKAMAAFLAQNLGAVNPNYKVSIDPNDPTNLLFTANKTGKVDPADVPTINVKNDPDGKLNFGAMNTINQGVTGKAPTFPAPTTTPNPDGTETIVSYIQSVGKYYEVTTQVEHTDEVTLDDNDLHGSLQATRELLTEAGSFATQDTVANVDENAGIKRGIPFYQKSLDLLAQKLATEYNKLNEGVMLDQDGNEVESITGTIEFLKSLGVTFHEAGNSKGGFGDGYYVNADGIFVGTTEHPVCVLDQAQLSVNDTVQEAVKKIRDSGADPTFANGIDIDDPANEAQLAGLLKDFMKAHGVNSDNAEKETVTLTKPIKMGGPLFSNRNDGDDTTGITASNISVSHSWSTGDVRIVPKFEVLFNGEVTDSTQNVNVGHMLALIEKSLVYNPQDLVPTAVGTKLFQGSFNDMLSDSVTTLGNDQRIQTSKLNTTYTSLIDLDTSREGVSGVDLNDETMNMMQYQKAYSAACRLMTAIDEAIDRLINNTGIAGR